MKIKIKLGFLVFLISLIFIFGLILLRYYDVGRLQAVFKNRTAEEAKSFDDILRLNGKSLENLAYDYTYWDEMVNFILNKDMKWAQQMLGSDVLSTYDANAIWVYSVDFSLVYSINNLKSKELEEIPLFKEIFNKLFAQERFCHFFMNTPEGIMEVRGATVHPSSDPERKTPPQGYFFTGRIWGQKYLAEFSELIGGTVTIVPLVEKEPSPSSGQSRYGIVSFSRILNGWDKSPLARLSVQVKSATIAELRRSYQQRFIFSLIFALLMVIILSIFLRDWISKPLYAISRSLDSENPIYIEGFKKEKDEFGNIAQLISKFFAQRSALVKEITERKKTEEELRNTYEQLKQTQLQLVQAAKMSAVGQLASGVAHEINNPLTGVLNNIQLLKTQLEQKKDVSPSELKEIIDIAEESASRCKTIVRTLLDYSRVSRGPFQFLSLNETIEKVFPLIDIELKKENILIQKEFQPDLPKILGDSQLLQQVIFDIIANARWAILQKSKEGGMIKIKTEASPDKNTVLIYISDSGIGITEANIRRIFEPFFSTKPPGEGTGLGLSIVYNIIRDHKGTIEVESQPNQGATFKISLPLFVGKST
jgi:signal transduction histidine kinase